MWLHFIFIVMIPFTILFWLNSSIYRKLSEQAVMLRRTGQKHLRRRETRLGRVSLTIVAVYLLCHTPKLVLTLCEIIFKDAKVIKIFVTNTLFGKSKSNISGYCVKKSGLIHI